MIFGVAVSMARFSEFGRLSRTMRRTYPKPMILIIFGVAASVARFSEFGRLSRTMPRTYPKPNNFDDFRRRVFCGQIFAVWATLQDHVENISQTYSF